MLLWTKLADIVLKDVCHGFAQRSIKKKKMVATFSRNDFAMLVICCVRTQMLMPPLRAKKPREANWPVRPFTSFEAAQLSKIMSVFIP